VRKILLQEKENTIQDDQAAKEGTDKKSCFGRKGSA
jgi:hypothetical protein